MVALRDVWHRRRRRRETADGLLRRATEQRRDARGVTDTAHDLTIEQLASAVGMSVRNIRDHHTRGLLPAPEVRARVGYYGAEHVARLKLILDMQADGFNLAAIERLLSGSDGLAERCSACARPSRRPSSPRSPS